MITKPPHLTKKIIKKRREKKKNTLFIKEKHVKGGYIKKFMNIIIYFSTISQKHAIFLLHKILGIIRKSGAFRSLATKRLIWEGGPFNNLPPASVLIYIFLYSVTVWSTPSPPPPPPGPHISPAAEVKKDVWLASKLMTICCRNSSFGFKALSWKYKCWVGIKIYGFKWNRSEGFTSISWRWRSFFF
jgi:hypothetical protein